MQEKTYMDKNELATDEVSIKIAIQRFGNTRRYIYQQWRLLLLAGLIGAAIGLVYALMKKPVYTASCTFVMEENDKSGGSLGQYSSLASMVGIDVGGSNSIFQGDNITQLYNSRLMLEKTLLTSAIFNSKAELLIDKYIDINHLRQAWGNNPTLKDINFDIPQSNFTIQHDSIINLIVNDISKNYLTVDKPDKKLSMISVDVKSRDQLFAKEFADKIVSNVNNFYIQTKIKGAQQNVLLLQHQADSVHNILNSSIGRFASASDANPNPDPASQQELRAPSQRRQIDVQAATAIYTEVVRNLEVARGALERETPLIQVIDQPVLPLDVERTGKIKSLLTGTFIAVSVMILWLISFRIYRSIMS